MASQINIILGDELEKKVREQAEKEDRSISAIIRRAVKKMLAEGNGHGQ